MLDLIFDMFTTAFSCVYESLKAIEINPGISLWTWLIICVISFGVLGALLRSFDITAVRDSTTATYRVVRDRNSSKEK